MNPIISLRTVFVDRKDLDSNLWGAFFDGLLGRELREKTDEYVRAYGLGCRIRDLDYSLDRYFALQEKPL